MDYTIKKISIDDILDKYNIGIISTGATAKKIISLGFPCKEISNLTKFKEILDGRVKTLNPKIHASILYKRKNLEHEKTFKQLNFPIIDIVIVNFYPFEKTLDQTKNHTKIIENIDIGGPTMVRAAAKNYHDVTVITSVNQYSELIKQLQENKGSTSLNFRKKLSQTAFSETAYYDSVICNYFNKISKNYFL